MSSQIIKSFISNRGILNFEKSGLIKLNNHCIGEFNVSDINKIRMIAIGGFKTSRNEIKSNRYKIVFDEAHKQWKLYKVIHCFDKEIATKKCSGKISFTKFNEIERNIFFNHS